MSSSPWKRRVGGPISLARRAGEPALRAFLFLPMYSCMLLQASDDNVSSELHLMNLLQDTLQMESLPSNIMKAALRTIKKLLEYPLFYSLVIWELCLGIDQVAGNLSLLLPLAKEASKQILLNRLWRKSSSP